MIIDTCEFRFGDTVKVVHFLGALKPWMYGFNAMTRKVIPPAIGSQTQQLEHVQKWWDVFINQVQPYLSSDCVSINRGSLVRFSKIECTEWSWA